MSSSIGDQKAETRICQQLVYAAAELGIRDLLKDDARSAAEMAAAKSDAKIQHPQLLPLPSC